MLFDGLLILVLSFVPVLLYATVLWWFDRYEKEPLGLLTAAFLWGAIPSIVLALILQIAFDAPLTVVRDSSQLTYELLGASVVAPLTEEAVKGLALLALVLLFSREIDSPVDGLIYGGLVGFGFAAVENAFYLFGGLAEGGVIGAIGLAFLRAGVFGLNHAMYTGFTGLGIALSLETRSKPLRIAVIVLGFCLAVAAHALHNALATLATYRGFVALIVALVVDWAGVFVLLLVALGASFVEQGRISTYGRRLRQSDAITAGEVEVLTSTLQRRLARLELLLRGDLRRWWLMRRYHQRLTEAAFAWHRLTRGDTGIRRHFEELEQESRDLRTELG
ncbi:MAG: PrsW family intramembrane metalloprotease [Anaerolineae bacterium]